jgi:Zn-dependent peptidase ImmA (M78 family)/transcriptional regulator with XRE-family HTH domain
MDKDELGRGLRRARLAAGLSQARVAEALGIPRPAVSRIESGRRSVSSVELAKLSRLYGKPASLFLLEPEGAPTLRYFRSTAPAGDTDREVIDEAADWCHYYAWLEQAAFGEQRYAFPTYRVPRGRAIDQGEHLGQQERRRLGLGGVASVPSVVAVLEHEGVKLSIRPFPAGSQVSGCYFFSTTVGPCVLVNRNDPVTRRRFTAAHEYSHFLVEQDGIDGEVCSPPRRYEFTEMRANAFAGAFLLPPGGVVARLRDLDVRPGEVAAEHAVHLMHHFGVSYQAVLWRLLNLGWISHEERERLAGLAPGTVGRALGYGSREPGDTESEPDRFRSVAIEAWRAGEISIGKLSELLDMPRAELRGILNHPQPEQKRPARAPAAEPDWL